MRLLPLISGLILVPVLAFAQGQRSSDALLDALRLDQVLGILQTEAVMSGDSLVETMTGEQDADGWSEILDQITAPDTLAPEMREEFADALRGKDVAAMDDFWTSDLGQRIVSLELSAREVLAEPDVQEAMEAQFLAIEGTDPARAALLKRFIEANGLIESNVAGAMNANAAFLRGLRNGDPELQFAPANEAEILAEVWSQEAEIRDSTEGWIHAFVVLAYQPLGDAELRDYALFSESAAGQAFNDALFAAFDRMFTRTSYETGEALARFLTSEDI